MPYRHLAPQSLATLLPSIDEVGFWMFESSPDCVKLLNGEGALLRMNRNGVCAMELPDVRVVIGRSWASLWPEESRPLIESSVAKALAGGIARFQAFCPTASGTPKWWDVTVTPVADDQGRVERLLSVSRDITSVVDAHRREEQALTRAKVELERTVAERTRTLERLLDDMQIFSYALAHDLRAPLGVINGFSAALLKSDAAQLSEDGSRYLQRIQQATLKMDDLIAGVLRLASLNQQTISREQIDLTEMAREITSDLAIAEPGRNVDVRIAPGLFVFGMRTQVRQLLQNLLSNAWKFTRHTTGARIDVRPAELDGLPAVAIVDNGAGFDSAYAADLFKPFHRLHRPGEFEGTGIGLAICHKVVALHNGIIAAQSRPGEATEFVFSLGEPR